MTGWIERHQHKPIPVKVSQSAMPCRAVQSDNIRNYHWTSCYEFFSFAFPTIVLMNAGTDIHLNTTTLPSKEKKETVLIAAGIRSLLLRARTSFSTQEKTHKHLTWWTGNIWLYKAKSIYWTWLLLSLKLNYKNEEIKDSNLNTNPS